VRQLIALAKAKPGELNYATGGPGSSNHIAAEMFKQMAGVDITAVQFRGSGGSVIGLMGGEIHMMITSPGSVEPHIKSGRVRAIAVTSADPTPLVPGLPSIAQSGVPGYEAVQTAGLFAPANTPAPIVDRLYHAMQSVLNRPEVKDKFFKEGTDILGNTPAQATAAIKAEIVRFGKVIATGHITLP
jgi:tripartite-type tricarboxylate transporter receptor subunit TctC